MLTTLIDPSPWLDADRPGAVPPDSMARILNAVRVGAPEDTACGAAGIEPTTLTRWRDEFRRDDTSREHRRFFGAIERARQEGIAARLALVQKAAKDDWRASAWLLERDEPGRYSMRIRAERDDRPRELTFAEALALTRPDRQAEREEYERTGRLPQRPGRRA